MSSKTFSNRSTKAEILKAYNELAKELKSRGGAPQVAEARGAEAAQEDLPVTQGQASIETIIHELTGIRARLGESVGTLQQQLLREATGLQDLRSEADEHTRHLRELHGIEVDESTLRGLVTRYQETQRAADESFAGRKQSVEAEIEARKVAWKKEQDEHARAAREADEAGQRARKREADEYGYETQRAQKAEADALAQTRKQRQAELDAAKEQAERGWTEREQELARREQEFNELKSKAAAAPKDLDAAVARAEAEGAGIAKRQAKIAADLQQKTHEGKKRVYELRVQELESTIGKQNEQIGELSKQLATALKQAQDLAMKAIDGASNSSSFAAVKEIALEQAKTSQKTK